MITARYIASILFLIVAGCTVGASMNEKNEKLIEIPDPVGAWVRVLKKGDRQVISSSERSTWLDEKGNQVLLDAGGKTVSSEGDISNFGEGRFTSAHLEKLHSYQIVNFNKKLKTEFGIESDAKDIYHLRIFSSQDLAYDLTVFFHNELAVHIIVCIDYCHNSPYKLLRVQH